MKERSCNRDIFEGRSGYVDTPNPFEAAIAEADRLLMLRPRCHGCTDEANAIRLIAALHAQGVPQDPMLAKACLERMRIAIATDRYPTEMLARQSVQAG